MFGFTLLAFLIVCAILALATFLVLKSGEQGQTKLGGCAGCAIGFALLAIAGLAASITLGVMVLSARSEIVRRGPVKSIELDFGDHADDEHESGEDHGARASSSRAAPGATSGGAESKSQTPSAGDATSKDSPHAVHLKLVIRGKEYPASISDWVRDHTEGDVSVTVSTEGDRTIVDYSVAVSREELKKLQRDLKKAIPGMKLPKGIKIEIKDPD
jgi:hypothetical protein